jgi:putative N6-adenine-specific DNA methylase
MAAMDTTRELEILLVTAPGLETELMSEVRELHFASPKAVTGGVLIRGNWEEVWRANLEVRGAVRVLARIGSFRALHLAQLDKRARQFAWKKFLRPDVAVGVEVTCRKSRIYHSAAAAQRIETAIKEELGAPIDSQAELCIKVRIEDDLCVISIDTSGEALHKRGHKEAVGKAPMRETMAALLLRKCGYNGAEPVLDPMCGSGTFVIEAAEIAAGLKPGRSRSFAFEHMAGFDAAAWRRMKRSGEAAVPPFRCVGNDRDAGAVRMSRANAERAGLAAFTQFVQRSVSDLEPPEGPPGLVIVNPPYGLRIGDKKPLYALYGALGQTLSKRFMGWRIGLVTSDASLAKATGLPFLPPGPQILHGGVRIQLFQTAPLKDTPQAATVAAT